MVISWALRYRTVKHNHGMLRPRDQPVGWRVPAASEIHLLDGDHLGNVVAQHVLDAMLERRPGRGASAARALHVETNHAIPVAPEDDIAAIARDGRPDPGVKQFLDLRHDLLVLRGHLLLG